MGDGVGVGVGLGVGVTAGDELGLVLGDGLVPALGDGLGLGLGDGLGEGVVSLVVESEACVAALPAKSLTSAVMVSVPSFREERSRPETE